MRTLLLAVAFATVSLAWALEDTKDVWDLDVPAPTVALRPESVDLAGYACAACHAEVAREWAQTAHAISWADELYRQAIGERKRPQLCHSCHVPQPLLAAGLVKRARARDEDLHRGISCESCHAGPDGTMLGPRGAPTSAHPSAKSEHMLAPGSNALCATCHRTNIGPVVGIAKDFEAARMNERGRSCIGCHMAAVERRWANPPDDPDGVDEDVPLRLGRSHLIQTPRDPTFLRRAFDVSLSTDGGRVRVVIANRAGHRVPGLQGREIRFEAQALDASGEVVARGEPVLDVRAYLPVDGSLEIPLEPVPAGSAEVRVIGLHVDPRAVAPTTFLDLRLTEE